MEYEYQNIHNYTINKAGTGCQSEPETGII